MKNSAPNPSERNREWTRIDANESPAEPNHPDVICLGFASRALAFIRGSTGLIRLVRAFAAVVFIATVLALRAPAAESPSVLLQKGIFAEETEGNVDAAIKIYEQITTEAATNRSVVAQAQYRLAVCYQKKGDKEQAIKLLNELVQQAPADADATKKARETLMLLGEQPSTALAVRKVTLPIAANWFWSVSSDGRYIPCQTDDLVVCEVSSGKSWIIKRGPFTKQHQPDNVVISPDGQWVAYDFAGRGIYVAKIDGSETNTVLEASDPNEVLSVDGWSADGTKLIADSTPKDHSTESYPIFSLDVRTRERKELRRTSGETHRFSWSTRYVARQKETYPRKITVFDSESGREETIVDHDAGQVIGWTPGDSKFLFSRRSETGFDLCSIGIKEGKPAGEPELVFGNFGEVRSLGITRDGTIYYSAPWNKKGPKDLWAMDGLLTWKAAALVAMHLEIPPTEILGPNNAISDKKFGFAATLPDRWTIKSAWRLNSANGASSLTLAAPGVSDAEARLAYHIIVPPAAVLPPGQGWIDLKATGSEPATSAETDSWLQKFAEISAKSSQNKGADDYENRAGSFAPRTIGGRRALTWFADFTKNEKPWVEYLTFIYDKGGSVDLRLRAPADKLEAVLPDWERFVASIRLP